MLHRSIGMIEKVVRNAAATPGVELDPGEVKEGAGLRGLSVEVLGSLLTGAAALSANVAASFLKNR
jgi:hypothetical protein